MKLIVFFSTLYTIIIIASCKLSSHSVSSGARTGKTYSGRGELLEEYSIEIIDGKELYHGRRTIFITPFGDEEQYIEEFDHGKIVRSYLKNASGREITLTEKKGSKVPLGLTPLPEMPIPPPSIQSGGDGVIGPR